MIWTEDPAKISVLEIPQEVSSYLPGNSLFSDVSLQLLGFLLLLPQPLQRCLELLLWERNHTSQAMGSLPTWIENK